jgi:hypothetical protein
MTSREKAFTKKHRRSPKVATFVELHAHEPPLERPHAADGASRPAISLSGSGTRRRAPVRVPSGQKLAKVGQHEQGQGRRKPAVDARRGAPRTAGRRSAASRGPRRGGGGRSRRLGCPPGGPRTAGAAAPPPRRAFVSRTLEARAHFVCAAFAAAAANDRDALPPLRTQTGRCAC